MEQQTMKALVYKEPHKYGLMDVPVPQIVEPTDVIARVTLATICTSDIHSVHGEIAAIPYPIVMGHEFCAEVVETGSAVKKLKPGDRCGVWPGIFCGECAMCLSGIPPFCLHKDGRMFGGGPNGCQAEYIRIPWADRFMYKIPEGLTEEDVLLLPDMLTTAWFGVTNARLKEKQSVIVIGVGPVGQCACLLAKKVFGARQVIAVDILQDRVNLAMKEGIADIGINPARDDMAKIIKEATGGLGVNAAIETAGTAESMAMAIAATKPNGIVSTLSIFSGPIPIPMPEFVFKNLELKAGVQKCDGLEELLEMIVRGKISTRFLQTHRAPLNDIEKGYEVFSNHQDGCMKWLITPYER